MVMWSGIEACASTVCANLPCYAPLLKRGPSLRYILGQIQSAITTRLSLIFHRGNSFQESASTERFANEPHAPRSTTTVETGVRRAEGELDLELGEIRVETTMGASQTI